MDNITKQVAHFATEITYDHFGEDDITLAINHIIDALGCAIRAKNSLPAKIIRKIAGGETPGKYAGRTLFNNKEYSLDLAGFLNSCMIRNYDFNDRFPGGHPSDGLGWPLALAGAIKMDGQRFLTSAFITYETFIRLAEASQMRQHGWDQGFAVAISTAAAMSYLLNLNFEQTASAIGITASSTIPLLVSRTGELNAWKNVATPFAGRNGVFAAMLAAEGMPGPENTFEGRSGLFENITGPFNITPFPNQGGPTRLREVLIKYWPIEANGQPVVWAALSLRNQIPPEKFNCIEEIEIFCDSVGKRELAMETEKWNPKTRETADHSMPYIFARTLVDGPLNISSFEEEPVNDPSIRPLMKKIKATVDKNIEAMMSGHLIVRVSIKMKDGTIHNAESFDPIGHPLNPMSEKDVFNKFQSLGKPVIGADHCNEIIEEWLKMRDAVDLRPLISIMEF